jgi:hypothetical protein
MDTERAAMMKRDFKTVPQDTQRDMFEYAIDALVVASGLLEELSNPTEHGK